MTRRVVVYGESDDLVQVEGDETVGEEFDPESDRFVVSFSEGTKLLVEFTADATWKITVLESGTASCSISPVGSPDNRDYAGFEHSEVATIVGDIEWVRGEDLPASD